MGSSSGSNRAQREAQEQERQRQARIDATTTDINRLFDDPSRQQQITDFQSAMQDFYNQDLGRQHQNAGRDLTFALARSGLTGGSRQVDANRNLGEDYQRGVLEAERRAQGAAAGLRGQDEQARLNLTSMAQAGLSSTNAATQAASAMRASLEGARANAQVQGLGDLFSTVGDINRASVEAKDKRQTRREFNNMYGPYYTQFSGFGAGGGY